ncbi:hypothetical protein NDU88_003042 [Pleurodeles waltl]|uniref:Uncharacterized protein n=1 Tax=Pleurodeles waltl TaxID=8319 RepID=A0AAV7PDI5_PLEWA|nr:hypothetical protein NDU88_003042 [Pleurodeles waltl]
MNEGTCPSTAIDGSVSEPLASRTRLAFNVAFLSNKCLASQSVPLPRDNSPGAQAWFTFRIPSQQEAGSSGSARDRDFQRLRC